MEAVDEGSGNFASIGTPCSMAATATVSALVKWSRCHQSCYRLGGRNLLQLLIISFLSAPPPCCPFGNDP
jgi:hypothetical protein